MRPAMQLRYEEVEGHESYEVLLQPSASSCLIVLHLGYLREPCGWMPYLQIPCAKSAQRPVRINSERVELQDQLANNYAHSLNVSAYR